MKKEKGVLSRLFQYAGKYKYFTVASCLLSGLSAMLSLIPFVCIWLVIRELFKVMPDVSNAQGISVYGWTAVGVAALSILLYFAGMVMAHLAAFHTAKNMKKRALEHILKLPVSYFSQNASGRLRKIIDDNAGLTESFLAHQLPDLAGAVMMPIAILVLLVLFDWRLGLLCILPLIVGFLMMKSIMSGKNADAMKCYMNALEDMSGKAVEYIRGIPVVKTFGQTVFSFKSFNESIENYKKFAQSYALSCRIPMTSFTLAINGAFLLLIPVGILFIAVAPDYECFLLDFIFYIIFTPCCAVMFNKIMYTGESVMIAKEAVSRVDALLAEKPLAEATQLKTPDKTDIVFDHVFFAYPGSKTDALKDVSFTVPAGKTYALVGPSGGGKSTTASLVPRFFDVSEGEIRIGGVDVRCIPQHTLSNMISFVFQNTRLFKTSVLDNIRMGKDDAIREEIMEALEKVNCDEIVQKLPDGLDTVIGDGSHLSGGEQQRIALARTILKNAPIVILDEATAFADPENERKIQLAFEKLTEGKTVLMIAHRLSTVRNADCILVLEEGKLKEQGTHDELLRIGGHYADMWKEYQSSTSWDVTGKEAICHA